MEYFKDESGAHTRGGGLCSDDNCPCPQVEIPRGQGYLYISPELVDFRRRFRTDAAALAEMKRRNKQEQAEFPHSTVVSFVRIHPVLVCEQGAKLRGLDLKIAAEDAKR